MSRTITCSNCGYSGSGKDFDVRNGPRQLENERFWSKVDVQGSDDCWPWLAGLTSEGYGTFRTYEDGVVVAHVYAYKDKIGPVPEGMCVCHSCDNRKCCNTFHHFLGTRTDNNHDRERKNRNGMAKLTIEQVHEIRDSDEGNRSLGERFGIDPSHVSSIKTGRRRKLV